MKLTDKQAAFAYAVSDLIYWINSKPHNGASYRVRFAHALRCRDCPVGMGNSLHKERLAVDLILDKLVNGSWVYQRSTKAYRFLGEKWETMHELARWGGRFGDGNHLSFEHGGRK